MLGGPATITLSASDATSGVAATFYTVDGGPTVTYGTPFLVTNSGSHTINYWSTDNAGNIETANVLNIRVNNPQQTTTVTGNVQSTLSLSVGSTPPNLGAFARAWRRPT